MLVSNYGGIELAITWGCTSYVAKKNALISYAVTVQLICAFVLKMSHMQKAGFHRDCRQEIREHRRETGRLN